MFRPMLPLTFGVAVLDKHTRLAHLEASASLLAALGAADVDLVHPPDNDTCVTTQHNAEM